jgi:hypothetical protein
LDTTTPAQPVCSHAQDQPYSHFTPAASLDNTKTRSRERSRLASIFHVDGRDTGFKCTEVPVL